jgi:hypothetical protein
MSFGARYDPDRNFVYPDNMVKFYSQRKVIKATESDQEGNGNFNAPKPLNIEYGVAQMIILAVHLISLFRNA